MPDPRLLEAGIPVLGICYGMQAMGYLLGGDTEVAAIRQTVTRIASSARSRAGWTPRWLPCSFTGPSAISSHISSPAPKEAIGRNTVTNIQSGVVYGWAGLVDGVVEVDPCSRVTWRLF